MPCALRTKIIRFDAALAYIPQVPETKAEQFCAEVDALLDDLFPIAASEHFDGTTLTALVTTPPSHTRTDTSTETRASLTLDRVGDDGHGQSPPSPGPPSKTPRPTCFGFVAKCPMTNALCSIVAIVLWTVAVCSRDRTGAGT